MKGVVRYSLEVEGDRGNFEKRVRFDVMDGYVGISQSDDGKRWSDRVLLSPAQVRALLAFIHPAARSRSPRTTRET